MTTGGSIQEISIRGRTLSVAADADMSRRLGGFSNAVEMNGDGSARNIMTRTGWQLSGLSVVIDDVRGDHEFLQEIGDGVEADPDGFYTITVTLASGIVWQGRGRITEEIAFASMAATAGITLAGPGKLTRQ